MISLESILSSCTITRMHTDRFRKKKKVKLSTFDNYKDKDMSIRVEETTEWNVGYRTPSEECAPRSFPAFPTQLPHSQLLFQLDFRKTWYLSHLFFIHKRCFKWTELLILWIFSTTKKEQATMLTFIYTQKKKTYIKDCAVTFLLVKMVNIALKKSTGSVEFNLCVNPNFFCNLLFYD